MRCSECEHYDADDKVCKINDLNRVENPDQDIYCDVVNE